MAYANSIAAGLTNEDPLVPFDLFAGEGPIVTDQGEAGVALTQFQPLARGEDGKLYPWNPDAGAATGTITFTGVGSADETVTINGHVITLKAAGAAGAQINIGATATETAQNLKTYINAHPDETGVKASGDAAAITVTALVPGSDGNAIATTETSAAASWGAATLAGGSDETENKAVAVAAQAIAQGETGPIYTGAIFNHEALVWPAGVTTLAARKAAFDGTMLGVRKLL